MKVGVISLGCSKNRVDSEVLLGILRDNGYEIVSDPASAEIAFVNTCGFIQPAKEESIDAIFEMSKYKRAGKLQKLFVTGCLAQRYPDALYTDMPEVDGFLGVHDYAGVLNALEDAKAGLRPLCVKGGERFLKASRVLTTPPYRAYIKISDGCDNRCAYCAIPLIRGPYRSRPYGDILSECRELAARGVTEMTFIAQDTSRYGNDFPEGALMLPKLLREASEIPNVKWIRVLYCYPDTVTDELLGELSSNPKLCPYLDLPLQHIDDDMLKSMNRRGDSKHIRALIKRCREYGIRLRTTMIVGFPGETDAQFERLLDFVRETRFECLGAFAYSPEDGTPACDMPGQVDDKVKAERLDALMLAQQAISLERNQSRVGDVVETLAEGAEGGVYAGRSALEAPEIDGLIRFTAARDIRAGEYVYVKITGCDAYDLTGVMIE